MARKFARRLISENPSISKAAERELAEMGDDAIPILRRIANNRSLWIGTQIFYAAASQIAIRLLAQHASPSAIRTLVALDKSESRRRQTWLILLAASAIFFGALMVERYQHLKFDDFTSAVLIFIYLLFAIGAWLGARRTASALAAARQATACGGLAIARRTKSMRKFADEVLRGTLAQVTEDVAQSFGKNERAAILALLEESDEILVGGAMHAVAQFGDAEVAAEIEAAAKRLPDLREQADNAIRTIRERDSLMKDRSTLLRASTTDEIDTTTLLRPASEHVVGDADL